MSADIIFDAEVIDAALAELRSHLPSAWLTAGNAEELRLLDAGDLADYVASDDALQVDTPAIIIRPLDRVREDADAGGVGGREAWNHPFRLVHIRRWADCYDASGNVEDNQTRARIRYSKEINKALFADDTGRLGSPTLTCSDGTAVVIYAAPDSWDLGGGNTEEIAAIRELVAHAWAIACDFYVQVLSG